MMPKTESQNAKSSKLITPRAQGFVKWKWCGVEAEMAYKLLHLRTTPGQVHDTSRVAFGQTGSGPTVLPVSSYQFTLPVLRGASNLPVFIAYVYMNEIASSHLPAAAAAEAAADAFVQI